MLVMISRMDSQKHHLSDTVFGATLGYVIGRSFAQHHLLPKAEAQGKIRWIPYFDDRSDFGLQAQVSL